ncbi:hypothetical protein [Actinospongicola halichondriae]|uniref:hypothetical protein n=1 Tax=Actinospongicola halichondriae TaxID=3236844 RepID=UPI003D57ACBB
MWRPLLGTVCALSLLAGAACSGDDDAGTSTTTTAQAEGAARFCDVYLDYLSDSTSENLTAVGEAADDDQVRDYIAIMESDADIIAVVAATIDLDDLARSRCQREWTAGAQGAGNTGAAAQAFFDALVAGDPIGARNVASANAIAVFEPWAPIASDPASGTPAIGDIDGQSFTVAIDEATLAECQVETGVVVACQIAE